MFSFTIRIWSPAFLIHLHFELYPYLDPVGRLQSLTRFSLMKIIKLKLKKSVITNKGDKLSAINILL